MSCDRSEAKEVNTDITNSSRIERTLLSEYLDQISGNWDYGVTKEVEFFKDIFTPVKLVSFTDPNLKAILNKYKDGKPISLDLEWNPFLKGPTGANLFQICTSRGCLLVHRKNGEVNQEFQKFITSNQFFMKDIRCDKVRIHQTFPGDIKLQICDIAVQVLRKNRKSENFENMVKTFSQFTPTGKFKNKKISCSKWNQELSPRQIIYAAFDAVGLYACYKEFEKYPLTFEDPHLKKSQIRKIKSIKSAAENKNQEVKKEDSKPPKQAQIIIPQQSNDIAPKEKKNPKEVASKATKEKQNKTIKPEKYALQKLLQGSKKDSHREKYETKSEKKRLGKAFNISLDGVSDIEFTKLPKFAVSYIGNWNKSELNVEFTKGVMTKIDYVYSDNPNLGAKLQRIDDGNTMALQIMVGSLGQIKCIGLISICSSLGCILIRCRNGRSSDVLNTFLATHKFVFIGNPNKIKKLLEKMINETFILDVDHEKAHHLLNYQPSKTVQSRSILISDWNIPMYSNAMVMYAANTVSHLYNFITH